MFRFAVFTLLTLNAVCVFGDRIVGGSDANITEVPYQISLIVNETIFTCGGSIINNKIILTAAHCLKKGSTYHVHYGSSLNFYGGTFVKVKDFKIHEDYEMDKFLNDIALLYLEKPIKYSKFAQPIALAGDKVKDDTMTTVSGWGVLYYDPAKPDDLKFPKVLQKALVPIVNIDKCIASYSNYTLKVGPGMICAGFDQGKIDVCKGDSGGPLVANNILYGITSWSFKPCAAPNYPAVYTDVLYFRKWIDSNSNENGV